MARTSNRDVDDYDWQSMMEGETVRIHCSSPECEHKLDSLTITRLYDGCIFNCFRCGSRGKRNLTSSPMIARQRLHKIGKKQEAIHHNIPNLKLPRDFINCAQLTRKTKQQEAVHELVWLYQYQLNDTHFIQYNIGYSRTFKGIVFPIYEENELTAYLIRYVNKPIKYKLITKNYIYNYNNNTYINNNRIYYNINESTLEYIMTYINNNKIYYNTNKNTIKPNILWLVEDCVSAIRIADCINLEHDHVCALLTTALPDLKFLRKYNKVVVWLDYDAKTKALKYIENLKFKGINCSSIITLHDPKAYDNYVITAYQNEHKR